MAEANEIRFITFFLLTIFPAYALNVIFSNALEDFKQKAEINTFRRNSEKIYDGTLGRLTYQPDPGTSKVIVYIVDRSRIVEIIRNAVRATIFQIGQELLQWDCELVFLGIDNFDDDEYHLISEFMADKIKCHPDQKNLTIETIGESHFDRVYYYRIFDHVLHLEKYQENVHICGGRLKEHLRSIPRGALRPVGSNNKEIRLYGYHPLVREVRWSVRMVNNTYLPEVDVSNPKYNFRIRYKTKKVCLLILGGKDYRAITSYGKRSTIKTEFAAEIMAKMTRNNEGLFVLGVFNFDWTEIDIVTQIILKHSVGWEDYDYNVFTCGYGMFNSFYLNLYQPDGRYILHKQQKSKVSELINVLMGEEVKERFIHMYCSDCAWKIPISLCNGRYFPGGEFDDFTFPWVNQSIAFIVYDPTEMTDQIDLPNVDQCVKELKWSGIYVVVIEAINFGPEDVHIIAEWIDCHRGVHTQNSDTGVIDSEQIAVLGGGIFDTIFQSESTTYKTLLNTKKNELKAIRNAFVPKDNAKRVYAALIDNPESEVWTYPMITVNGHYEPDLIPDKNMFDTTDGKNIFFIITSANEFHRITRMENMDSLTSWLRGKIEHYYPYPHWRVFLMGLDNFEERDYHLFAELVNIQTHDERFLEKFVCAFNYGIGTPMYQYKDTPPFRFDKRVRIESYIMSFFQFTSRRLDLLGSSFH